MKTPCVWRLSSVGDEGRSGQGQLVPEPLGDKRDTQRAGAQTLGRRQNRPVAVRLWLDH